MNSLNVFLPPDDEFLSVIDEEDEAEREIRIRQITLRRIRALERQRRRNMAAQQAKDVSSDSEADEINKIGPKAKADVTPAESTSPQELVILDPYVAT